NNPDGSWLDLTKQKNSAADISTTGGQMPRLLGLAQASKIYREVNDIDSTGFSVNGNEVAWGTIGNASTSEGIFFETINAAGVMQVPMVVSIWDDDYGISVHAKHQTTKENIGDILKGVQRTETENGFEIIVVNGWDYVELTKAYSKAESIAREQHVPVIIHVKELTQPQGHSTSGSHERYKSKKRLDWEKEYDCNIQFRSWIVSNNFATTQELEIIEKQVKKDVRDGKKEAWLEFITPIKEQKKIVVKLLAELATSSKNKNFIDKIKNDLIALDDPAKRQILGSARKALRYVVGENSKEKTALIQWIDSFYVKTQPEYSSHLYSETKNNAVNVAAVAPLYGDNPEQVDGRIVLRDNFDKLFANHKNALVFGEDSGKIGDVNQGLDGLQEKYGELRVADTGIREASIVGQGIGLAMRGLRPIAEIQYLD